MLIPDYIDNKTQNPKPNLSILNEREHLTCAMSINGYSCQKLENLQLDHKEK
jgi:hypothetical protein